MQRISLLLNTYKKHRGPLSSFFLFLFLLSLLSFLPNYIGADNNLPDVFTSSDMLFQADALLVMVKNEPWPISGNLGNVPLRFFRSENQQDWVAIVGILINKTPGNYKLSVRVPNKITFQKNIKVAKRYFPFTQFPTTPELLAKGMTAKKIISTIGGTENKTLEKFTNVVTPRSYVSRPFSYPLGEIAVTGRSGAYGDIRKYKNYTIQHLGVDLKAKINTPVFAINNGVVAFTKSLPDYGNTLMIDHGLGVYSLYLHLNEFIVPVGKEVRQGDVIALSGATGYATGPHLHFSIKVRGATVDPLKFIAATQYLWRQVY